MNKMSSTSVLVQMTSSPLFFLRQIYTSKLFGNPLRFRDFPSRDSYFARIFQLKKFEESARFEPGPPRRRARALPPDHGAPLLLLSAKIYMDFFYRFWPTILKLPQKAKLFFQKEKWINNIIILLIPKVW